MSKYIIELDDRIKLVTSVGVTENGVVYTTSDYVHNLEELNSDYINENFGSLQDDAYKRGLSDASASGYRRQYEDGYKRGYKNGRNVGIKDGMCEAWEAARKIGHASQMKMKEMGFDFTGKDWCYNPSWYGVMNYTASEAIAKIKAYDNDTHSDRIEVGDEVRFLPNDRIGIVTACHVPDVYAENDKYAVFCGTTVEYVLRQHITKTGKHHDIRSILEAMRE